MTRRLDERPPTLAYDRNFCRVTAVRGMEASLTYDLDHQRWPWLALPAFHPVLVEKYQYFSSVTTGWVVLDQAPSVQSALTQMTWRCSPASFSGEQAKHGHCKLWQRERDMGYELVTQLANGQEVTRYTGAGFAFADRDFKTWRAKSRKTALAQCGEFDFEPAKPTTVGLEAGGLSYVTPLSEINGQPATTACVMTDNGFHPAHPFHTGSGDHVNAGHLFDCVQQAAHLVLQARQPLTCTGGRAEFMRFVELDVPFTIRLEARVTAEGEARLSFALAQLGRDNARITLTFGIGDTQ